MEAVHISQLEIRNIGHFEHLLIPFATVMLIYGDNGTGKSTLLNTLSSVFEAGNHPELLRIGSDEGFVKLTLSDGSRIEAVVTEDQTTLKYFAQDGRKITSKKQIQALANAFSFDPLKFLRADKNEREKILRKILPILFDRSEIQALVDFPVTITGEIDLKTFDEFLAGREGIRSEANKDRDRLEATIAQFQQSLPAESDSDWSGMYESKLSDLNSKRSEVTIAVSQIQSGLDKRLQIIKDKRASEIDGVRRQLQIEIDKAERNAEAAINDAMQTADFEKQQAHARIQPEIETLATEVATAKAKADEQKRCEGLRAEVHKLQQQMRSVAVKATAAQEHVNRLRDLRRAKLNALPIPGVEVKGGQILVDGKDLDTQLNTTEQYKVLLQIGSLAAGPIPFIVLDRCESLSTRNKEWIINGARALGFQVLLTEVIEGKPLTVKEINTTEDLAVEVGV